MFINDALLTELTLVATYLNILLIIIVINIIIITLAIMLLLIKHKKVKFWATYNSTNIK